MSHGISPWQHGPPERRPDTYNTGNTVFSSSDGPQQYRLDAPEFTPGSIAQPHLSSVQEMRLNEQPQSGPPSPFYPLQTKTFMPPETPSLPRTPSPDLEVEGLSTLPTNFVTPRKLSSEGPGMGFFHTPGSIWDSLPNETIKRVRGSSELFSNNPGFSEIQRPRSRSEVVQNPSAQSPIAQRGSQSSSKIPSTSTLTGIVHDVASPSPRRQLFPQQGINGQAWSKSPETVPGIPGTPGGVRVPTAFLPSTVPRPHPSRRTIGQLPANTNEPFAQQQMSQPLAQSFSRLHVDTGFAKDNQVGTPFFAPNSAGTAQYSHPGQSFGLRPRITGFPQHEYGAIGQVSPLGTITSSPRHYSDSLLTSCISPARPTAKALADLIRSGAAEEPGQPGVLINRGPFKGVSFGSAMPVASQQVPVVSALPSQMRPEPLVQHWLHVAMPTYEELVANLPFVERSRLERPINYGVIKITDIPYNTTKSEVVACIGEKAPLVKMPRNAGTYSIHIIMERSTAKSNDCYVEVESPWAAQDLVTRLESFGRRTIQARRITMELSSQELLMKELFPRSKCVRWEGCNPIIVPSQDPFSSGFGGFVASEEVVMMVKFAQNPQRSRFAMKHLQRTYESMISLLFKYPWWAVDHYTLKERDTIFDATLKQVATLAEQLRRGHAPPPLSHELLEQLLDSGLMAAAFSEKQRARLIDATEGIVSPRQFITRLAPEWPFEVLGRKDTVSEEMVMYFASIMKTATAPATLAERAAAQGTYSEQAAFGDVQIPWPANKQDLTMAQAAKLEWGVVETLLKQVAVPPKV